MNNLFSSPWQAAVAAIIVAMIVVYWTGRAFRLIAPGQKVFYLADIFGFIFRIPEFLLTPFIRLVSGTATVLRISAWLERVFSDDALKGYLDRYYAKEKNHKNDLLLTGDLLGYAQRNFPQESYPFMYRHCPEDIPPQMVIDGRLPNGDLPAPVCAPSLLDYEFNGQCFRFGAKCGVTMFFVACTILTLANLYVSASISNVSRPHIQLEQRITHDMWSASEVKEAADALQSETDAIAELRMSGIKSSLPTPLIPALALGFLTWFGVWRGVIKAGVSVKIKPLTRMYKEATVRYKSRLDAIHTARRNYIKQLEIAEIDTSPLLTLGHASGSFRFRGALNSWERGAPVKISIMDATTGIWAAGLTGSGKTVFLKALFSSLMDERAAAIKRGEPRYLSFFIGDGKATLWKDLIVIAEKAGQLGDVRVIGCDVGQWGVDLCEGTHPMVLGDTIMSMLTRGKPDGEIWGKAAKDIINKMGMLLEAAEFTPFGYDYLQTYGERLYSLSTLAKYLQDGGDYEQTNELISAIYDAIKTGNYYGRFDELATAELDNAMNYIQFAWRELAPETQTSVKFNVNCALSGFTLHAGLRRQFATGGAEKQMNINEVWGEGGTGSGITMINLSELEDGGESAKLVMIFLNTLLHAEARKREMRDKNIRFKERCFKFWDELQTIVTTGTPLSDAEFCLVNRSTGLSYVVASQSFTALENVMGEVAARNFTAQMRNKIILQTDEITNNLAIKLSGESLRSFVFKSTDFESFEAMCREQNTSLDAIITDKARLYVNNGLMPLVAKSMHYIKDAPLPVNFDTNTTLPVEFDGRFYPPEHVIQMNLQDTVSRVHYEQSATWRQEDKLSEWMKEGNNREPILKPEDMTGIGANALMIVQRAGQMQMDIVYM